MPMKVTIQKHISVLLKFFNYLLYVVNCRMCFSWWLQPLSVQVNSSYRASCISNDYPIRIQHWYYFKDKIVSQNLCIKSWPCKIINYSFHHIWRVRLPWVNSRANYYSFTMLNSFCIWVKWCYYKHITIILCYCLTKGSPSNSVFLLWISLKCIKVSDKICICVRVTMSYIYNIIVMLKLGAES